MKKILLTSIILLVSLTAISQTYLDYLLFEKCNQYRKENGLKEWKWSNKAFKPASHHSNYQVSVGTMGHSENTITPKPASRLDYYHIDWAYSGENCAVILKTSFTNEYIATKILEMWKKSKLHNDLLLNPIDGEVGAISCKVGRNYKWSKDEYDWIFCTLTVFTEHNEYFVID